MSLLHNHEFKSQNLFFCLSDENFAGFDSTGRIDFTQETKWFQCKENNDLPEIGDLCLVAPEWADVFMSEYIDDETQGKHSFVDRLKATRIARFFKEGKYFCLSKCTDEDFYSALMREHMADPHPQEKFSEKGFSPAHSTLPESTIPHKTAFEDHPFNPQFQ